jgi:hypothetical protein
MSRRRWSRTSSDEWRRLLETTGRIEAALAEISAINLELFARGKLD